jgi:acetyltransferase-like isoleucine patch superfamily enzyme
MSGRNNFEKYYFGIRVACIFFKILPFFARKIAWNLSKLFDGNLAVAIRYSILFNLVKGLGRNVYIGTNVIIKNPENLMIGDNVSIHDNCYLDANGGILIGNNVSIAHATSILSFEHTWGEKNTPIKYNPIQSLEVKIFDDVWVGCGVRILSGVEINPRSIVAAGAVITKSFEGGVILAGIPAKVVKKI